MELWQLAAAVLMALALRWWCFELIRVQGNSMAPTLRGGDMLWVTRFDYRKRAPHRQDLVICYYPGRYLRRWKRVRQCFVKRVVGLPGETVSICEGVVYIDGKPLREPYLDPARNRRSYGMEPVTLGEREVFVLGDNRDNSNDSRRVGPIPLEMLRGRVRRVLCHLAWLERRPRRRLHRRRRRLALPQSSKGQR